MTWRLTHILGLLSVSFSFLDMFSIHDIVDGMPYGFRMSINLLSCSYLLIQVLRTYEKLRSEKIDNKIKELEYRKLLNSQPKK